MRFPIFVTALTFIFQTAIVECDAVPTLNTVVSRKVHGTGPNAATFDIKLLDNAIPLTSGIYETECRSGGADQAYTLVFTFANQLQSVADVSIESGTAVISSAALGPLPTQYTVNLSGVNDRQEVIVALRGVTDAQNSVGKFFPVSMRVLIGDALVSAAGAVNATDVSKVKNFVGNAIDASSFRADVNASGSITATDVSSVKNSTGRAISRMVLPRLKVCGRFLCRENDEKQFFWLGDTGWWLMNLSDSEVSYYLSKRAAQGFTGIQVMAVMLEIDETGYIEPAVHSTADYYGNWPTDIPNPPDRRNHLHPNLASPYWARFKRIIQEAEDKGLYVGVFLVWGDEVTTYLGTDTTLAYNYGQELAAFLNDNKNVWYSVSGEYDFINGFTGEITQEQALMFHSLAQGLAAGSPPDAPLKSIHPAKPQTSLTHFGDEDANWLDVHMLQSGHRFDPFKQTARLIDEGYVESYKPIFDGEAIYENIVDQGSPQGAEGPRANASIIRFKAYEAVFAGAFGHTYGHDNVHKFWTVGDNVDSNGQPLRPFTQGIHWSTAIDYPGAQQVSYLRKLIECHSQDRIPDQDFVTSGAGPYGLSHMRATRDSADGNSATHGTYALVYVPQAGMTFTVNTAKLTGSTFTARWFNPADNSYGKPTTYSNLGAQQSFTSPTSRTGDYVNDWVLVLESENFSPCSTRQVSGL